MRKPVAKLKIMCARSMHEVVTALAYSFTNETGHEVELSFGTVGALQKRLDDGETADVLISGAPVIERMEKAGTLVAGSSRPVAMTRIGVAVRDGAVAPDITTPEAFRHTLVAAKKIAFSDAAVGGSAGVYLARMFVELGLGDAIKHKGMPQQTGGEVARRVAEGKADIGMTLIAEIVPVPGAHVIGPLPAPLGSDTSYAAAVMTPCRDQDAARAFIAAITAPTTHDTWKAAGFESAR
jgi:molybdate transport system substrate-binding protein